MENNLQSLKTILGEIRNGWEIGFSEHCKWIWVACEVCGKERWVVLKKGQPESTRCIHCAIKPTRLPIERFLKKIRVSNSGCWEWMGGLDKKGYGHFAETHRKSVMAHRFSYKWFRGEIPIGLHLDHLCRNPKCVNPDHLEAVTIKENLNRGIHRNTQKMHCPQGHPYDEVNTYISNVGKRICRICIHNRSVKNGKRIINS
jgi:hypothetical protein